MKTSIFSVSIALLFTIVSQSYAQFPNLGYDVTSIKPLKDSTETSKIYKTKENSQSEEDFIFIQDMNKIYEIPCDDFSALASEKEKMILSTSKVQNAKEFISTKIESESIVFVNEHHRIPSTRVFFQSLLPSFKNQGFKYLFVEALNFDNSEINKRGYPLNSDGFYVKNPTLANLLRSAMSLGFIIVPFEASKNEAFEVRKIVKPILDSLKNGVEMQMFTNDTTFSELNLSCRDYVMAKHISDFHFRNPKEKILVYTGHGHIKETIIGNYITMAHWFKKMTKLNPLTIEQAKKSSFCDGLNLSRLLTEKEPFVLVDSLRNSIVEKEFDPFSNEKFKQCEDIQVYHAPPSYLPNGRISWYSYLVDNQTVNINTSTLNIDYPCLILAYLANEYGEKAVPIDLIERASVNDQTPLFLKKGEYTLDIKSKTKSYFIRIKVK